MGGLGVPEATVLRRARGLLLEAESSRSPAERFRLAHLAALRSTAALFAAINPDRGPTRRPVNAWTTLAQVAPDLSGWARVFAGSAPKRAAAEAGLDREISDLDAEQQVLAARAFLDVVEERIGRVEVALAG